MDAAKMKREIFLAIPNIGLSDIGITIKDITNSYDSEIFKNYKTTNKLLGNILFKYKQGLKELKDKKNINEFIENYHRGRDLYHSEKMFSSKMLKDKNSFGSKKEVKIISSDPDKVVKISLLRNFSGLKIQKEKKDPKGERGENEKKYESENSLKYTLDKKYEKYEKEPENEYLKKFKTIKLEDIRTIDLIKDNILSKESRFLLLISEK